MWWLAWDRRMPDAFQARTKGEPCEPCWLAYGLIVSKDQPHDNCRAKIDEELPDDAPTEY